MNKLILFLTTLFAMTQAETLPPFSELSNTLKPGDIYQHYKGQRYKILAVARHSETLEELVVYQALYGTNDVWVRPLPMFLEHINTSQPRFTKQ